MSIFLAQSTQIKVRIGPFVDVTDGATPETGITLAAADQAEALKANGAATADISSNTWAAVTGADGWYDLTLSTTDTNTVGELVIVVQDVSVCLPVFQRFYVVEEAVHTAMYAASAAGPLQSTTAGRTLDVSATGEAGVDWANVGSPTTTVGLSNTTVGVVTTLTGHTAQTGDSYAIVNGASGLVAIKSDTAATLTDTADMQPKLGTPVTSIAADIASVQTDTTAILDDTGTTGVPIATGGIASTSFAANSITTAAFANGARGAIDKNVALSNFMFQMIDSADHVSPKTGLTVSATVSLDAAAFGAATGTVTEVSSGWYQFDAAAGDTNGDTVAWRFTATGADDLNISFKTVA